MANKSILYTLLVLACLMLAVACEEADVTRDLASDTTPGAGVDQQDGLTLTADPPEVVIDLDDPNTPSDPNTGTLFGETTLTATLIEMELPVPGVDVTFSSNGGALASDGTPVPTNDDGEATDTLRVFEDDPDEIEVTAATDELTATIVVKKILLMNRPPVADAGPDLEVECASPEGALVTLDGSASSDPDSTPGTNDDIVSFEWFEGMTSLGEGETLEVQLALGSHTITLQVTDSQGETASDEVVIQVVDTTAPTLSIQLHPSVLWPPHHQMVAVHAAVTVVDACSETTVTLVSVTSNEPDDAIGIGDGSTVNDIQDADLGTEDYDLLLRAERAGTGSGRVYTVEYTVTDASGNETSASGLVTVPHDQGMGGVDRFGDRLGE